MKNRKIRKLKKIFPDLYEWIKKLVYPLKLEKIIKIDYIRKNTINTQQECHCQLRLFSLNNIFTLYVKKPCSNYPDGLVYLYRQITIIKKKKEVNLDTPIIEGEYTQYSMNKCAEQITLLEGKIYPIKTFINPKKKIKSKKITNILL